MFTENLVIFCNKRPLAFVACGQLQPHLAQDYLHTLNMRALVTYILYDCFELIIAWYTVSAQAVFSHHHDCFYKSFWSKKLRMKHSVLRLLYCAENPVSSRVIGLSLEYTVLQCMFDLD